VRGTRTASISRTRSPRSIAATGRLPQGGQHVQAQLLLGVGGGPQPVAPQVLRRVAGNEVGHRRPAGSARAAARLVGGIDAGTREALRLGGPGARLGQANRRVVAQRQPRFGLASAHALAPDLALAAHPEDTVQVVAPLGGDAQHETASRSGYSRRSRSP
jgi:hypothetical protein